MALILYLFSRSSWGSPRSHSSKGKKLHKRSLGEKTQLPLKAIFDIDRDHATLDLASKSKSEDELTLVNDSKPHSHVEPEQHIKFAISPRQSTISTDSDSESYYSIDEMQFGGSPCLRRTRAKTPVFMIGQLEKIQEAKEDKAMHLASEYQASLPHRTFTPLPVRMHRKLRKIKCQVSLRDLILAQEGEVPRSPGAISSDGDGETLVGSEPTSPYVKLRDYQALEEEQLKIQLHPEISAESNSDLNQDIGLKICADLLTNELVTALFKHHPASPPLASDRASDLQILLLIEAYELALKQLLEKGSTVHVTEDHVRSFQQVLEHWLDVLYEVYDRMQEARGVDTEATKLEWPCKSPAPIRFSRASTAV